MPPQRSFIFLLLLLPVLHSAGQNLSEKNFVRHTMAEGMSHNTVFAVTQDSTGFVWIATPSGLNRYNGSRFLQYHSYNDSLSLASEEVSGIVWLDKFRMVVYAAGVHIINTRTGESHNLFIPYHDKQYQYKFNMIEMVKGDEQGNIFILSRSGFYHFDKNYKLVSRFDFYTENQVLTEHFFFGRDLFELDDQHLLIVSIGGLYLYDKQKKAVKKMEADDYPLLAEFLDYPGSFNLLYRFFQPSPGRLFVMKLESDSLVYVDITANKKTVSGLPIHPLRNSFHYRSKLLPVCDTLFYVTDHYSGLYKMRFYPESGAVRLYPEKYLQNYLCNSLMKDQENNLWIGTNNGLLRQDPDRSKVELAVMPAYIEDSLPSVRFDDIYVVGNKVCAATRGYGGLLLYDKTTFRFDKQVFFDQNDPPGNSIYTISLADPTTLILGTGGPLFLYNVPKNKLTPLVPPNWRLGFWTNDLCRDNKGDILVGGTNNFRFNPVTKRFTPLPTHPKLLSVPFVIEEDRNGDIWMAGHGLARYNPVADSFDLLLDSFPFIKMPDKQINSLVIDRKNTAWFNCNNNGLMAYDIKKRTYRHFTRQDGLPDNNIASMIIIGDNLWMSCYTGIACMDMNTTQITSFGKEDGFPDMQVFKCARFFYDSADRQLYIGFSKAIARFNPYTIPRRKSPPHIFIETLVVNDQKNIFLPGKNITTSYSDNEVMITIGSINFSDSYSQRFAYRILKGDNSRWQQLGTQPSFSISSLSPGQHTIQVKSFSANNRWPEQVKEITILILPPFWQKSWFVLLLTAAIIYLLYLFIHWRTGLARKKEMEKTHVEKLKADDYKNQFELEQISNYFSSSLTGKKKEEEVLWDVANNLIARMNYVDCMIYLWNDDKTKMIQKAAFGPKGKPEFISASVFDVVPGQGIVGHVIQECQPILVDDTRKDPRYRVDEEFRLSEICVPIIHNGELMGIIDSEHYAPGYFKERDIKILTTIATLIGNKLKQIESERILEVTGKELANINEQLAEAQLSALQAQMNPHFVFNALNSIKRMILDEDNDKASRYLSKFALMIRMTLNHSKDIFVTLDENIEYLKAYLEMEQLRFDESFTYSIFTGENIDASETPIPSLMIQPLAENAIWHGLLPIEGEKKIRIGFIQCDNRITCTIEDNGIGIRESQKLMKKNRSLHHSLGLENLRKRIKIMNEKYDTDCSLEITDMKDIDKYKRGTVVILRFNIVNP